MTPILAAAMFGFLYGMPWYGALFAVLAATLAFAFLEAPLALWTAFGAVLIAGVAPWPWVIGFLAVMAIFHVRALRTALVSVPVMKLMKALKFLPVISDTERTALTAGTVWIDGDLFSGKPDWAKLVTGPYPDLTAEERAFLDGPCQEVCRMVDDWKVFQERDLPPHVWDYLKREGFFGLIIPKEYGGKGFSASMNSAVVAKLSSRSGPLGITVMVPNSLGPAELLAHYGTDEQKDHYLPRLARGEEMPCFALTEPNAGSDAGAMSAEGVVFEGEDGELYVRLNWSKRYITLAAISTVLGLAFKLRDPDNHLGKGEDVGITCALIPSNTPGVELGRRHDPLGVPFYNCPTEGHDVVVKLDEVVIGGRGGIGVGWRMLMESLAAGRGISLPASSTAQAKMCARAVGAYAATRKQFGISIGKFEGIHEPLARIGLTAYTLEAARRTTCGGLDAGAKPAVVTAIAKYTFTELARASILDAMDVLGGKAISLGPRNPLAHAYMATPISITVEGANILTRTLIIFGQGAIRCHPYAWKEVQAVEAGDGRAFDAAFFGHVGHVVRNLARSVVLSLSRGHLSRSPVTGPAARYYKKLSWASASFAITADLALGLLGGDLKRKESLTGRFADVFSWLYLGNAVLRRFEAEGRPREDIPFLHGSMQRCLAEIQAGFEGIYRNFDHPLAGPLFKGPIAFWSRTNPIGVGVSDKVAAKVAEALQRPGEQRDRLTSGMYIPTATDEAIGQLEHALELCTVADAIERKLRDAVKKKRLTRKAHAAQLQDAVQLGVITADERELLGKAEAARAAVVAVDDFTLETYLERGQVPSVPLSAVAHEGGAQDARQGVAQDSGAPAPASASATPTQAAERAAS